ncbi:SH3 domain-containing protein [Mucilaginibacter ginsenosidivorax]|uniref:SH3 domain-containing protein n=1 Tax=Mucilaginibacter ginsenosidivorax TaxID=862126 RepID=A0A5B8VYS0_9SPHI|nr:SH3 domain-containing protein [Mucilaginibacter ginsenosidivorax]QEC75458.1 SH3 domain-containing protein [Mucilaginibacter ginsenosidivorax]
MKKLIASTTAFVLFVTITFNAGAQANNASKSLKVWLLAGVNLKNGPADNSKTIATIPYGTIVKPVKPEAGAKTLTVDFNTAALKEPYKLSGKWIKVEFKGKGGYLFDGYLSAMPALEMDDHGFVETEDAYLKRNYGVLKIAKRIPKKGAKETSIYYKNGAVTTETYFDGCADHKLLLKNISLNEAMLFENVLHKNADAAQNIKVEKQQAGGVKISSYDCD